MDRFKISRKSCWMIIGASLTSLAVIVCSGGGYTPVDNPTVECIIWWIWMSSTMGLIFIDHPTLGLSNEHVRIVGNVLLSVVLLCVALIDGYGAALCCITFYLSWMALDGKSFMKHVVRNTTTKEENNYVSK